MNIPKNILVLLSLVIIATMLYTYSCGKTKSIEGYDEAIDILKEQNDQLRSEQQKLKQSDSLKTSEYNQRVKSDSIQLANLKKTRDEKIIRIDNSDNDGLRRLLSEN